jgi:hypothetical protein
MNHRTQEDINELKADWLQDPCWDIEDSAGFEAHREELTSYRLGIEAKLTAEREAQEAARRIQTIRTRMFANYDVSNRDDDDRISKLIAAGWQIANISVVAYVDNGGDWPIQIIERFTTLTR